VNGSTSGHGEHLDVVAIGASAGGIAALTAVLSALPDDYPAAVVIVLHLDPHHRSTLASLLARTCSLPVHERRAVTCCKRPWCTWRRPARTLCSRGACSC
jgi:chemotaxis response regulator CheB